MRASSSRHPDSQVARTHPATTDPAPTDPARSETAPTDIVRTDIVRTDIPRRCVLRLVIAALAVLLLADCSAGPQEPQRPATTTTSRAAYSRPTVTYDATQARILTTVGQRDADALMGRPVEAGMGSLDYCKDYPAFTGSETSSWLHDSSVDETAIGGTGLRDRVTSLSRAVNSVAVLDDSPSAVRSADERLKRWPTCEHEGPPRTPVPIKIPGAATAVGFSSVDATAHKSARHTATAAARVQNLVLFCEASGPAAKAPTAMATSCLRDMAKGTALLAHPAASPDPLGTKVLLAGLAGKSLSVDPQSSFSTPCPTRGTQFVRRGSPAVQVSRTPADNSTPPEPIAVVMVERLSSPAAARAKLASGRRLLTGCAGHFVLYPKTYPSPGAVDGTEAVALGDGGVALLSHATFWGAAKPEKSYQALFSTQSYVVHVIGFGEGAAVQRNASFVAQAFVQRVEASG